MNSLDRLEKLHKLIKLQEQDILAEFKETQRVSLALRVQIEDLVYHSQSASEKLMHQSIAMDQLNLVRSFNVKIEVVLEKLNIKLQENDTKLLKVAEKIKDIRSRIKSIERLIDRHQQRYNYQQQKYIQQQIEENINYTSSSQD